MKFLLPKAMKVLKRRQTCPFIETDLTVSLFSTCFPFWLSTSLKRLVKVYYIVLPRGQLKSRSFASIITQPLYHKIRHANLQSKSQPQVLMTYITHKPHL